MVRCRSATRPLSKDRCRAYGAEAFGSMRRTGRDSLGAIRARRWQSDVPARSQDRTGTNGVIEKVNARPIDLRGSLADRRPRSPDDLSSRQRGLHPFWRFVVGPKLGLCVVGRIADASRIARFDLPDQPIRGRKRLRTGTAGCRDGVCGMWDCRSSGERSQFGQSAECG